MFFDFFQKIKWGILEFCTFDVTPNIFLSKWKEALLHSILLHSICLVKLLVSWSIDIINGLSLQLLVACLDDKARDEGTNVDVNKAKEDATQLYKDGEQKMWGTNNKTFIDIFAKRSRPHLAAVDAAYDKLYGHSLEEVSWFFFFFFLGYVKIQYSISY